MPKLKLPAPPLPDALKPRAAPARRRAARRRRWTHAKEAGTTVVDWVDERTSLSAAPRAG